MSNSQGEMQGHRIKWLVQMIAAIVVGAGSVLGGQTGKIAGKILDAQTKEPLAGGNVVILGTTLGAAADLDGFYHIGNVPPGRYTLQVTMVGYEKTTITDVVVRIDLTTQVDVNLNPTVIEGAEVVIVAERPLVQKDLTSTSVTVSADDLQRIPTENIGQVINIQAGVVGGHFRGGRINEVAYLIDGVSVNDPYNGQMALGVENNSIREMEIVSGTFNAEYGQAMSGIVNIVSQEGGSNFHGAISVYSGDYFTGNTDVFPNTGSLTNFRTRNAQLTLGGPIMPELSFYATGRYLYDDGHLYGKRVYTVGDRAPYTYLDAGGMPRNPSGNPVIPDDNGILYIYPRSGDGEYVPMNPSRRVSANGKIAYYLSGVKFTYSLFWDDNWNKYYDHSFKWTPDGIMNHYRTNWVHSIQAAYAVSVNTLHTLKLTSNDFKYKGYLYEDPFDSRYVDPSQGVVSSSAYTFRAGGNQTDRYDRSSKSVIGQWSFTSQVTTKHRIGMGAEGRLHRIYSHGMSMRNKNTVETDPETGALLFVLGYPDPGTPGNQSYLRKPVEVSAYIQDKMEYDIMIVNAGVRVDYFDPASSYPADLRNPGANPRYPNAGKLKNATTKFQVSPRVGISFPITDQGIIHFSYGHFFQIPAFENLYYNSEYLVIESSGLSNIIGNPDLDAQRTVMYELGLQQVFFTNVVLDFTVYYRDIRNLLGMEIVSTYEGIKYARFVNRDYGNVKGFILSLDRRMSDLFGIKADYTYQIAEGNASDPYAVYYNNQTDPPTATNKKVVPLNWDQRSTLSLSVTVGDPGDWTVATIMQYGSGFPYTEDIRVSNGLRFENGGLKPTTFNVDLRAEKSFRFDDFNLNLFVLVYNLLDRKNEMNVNAASGRTNVDLFTDEAGTRHALNTIAEYLNNPANFSAPRQVRIGFSLDF